MALEWEEPGRPPPPERPYAEILLRMDWLTDLVFPTILDSVWVLGRRGPNWSADIMDVSAIDPSTEFMDAMESKAGRDPRGGLSIGSGLDHLESPSLRWLAFWARRQHSVHTAHARHAWAASASPTAFAAPALPEPGEAMPSSWTHNAAW